MSDSSDGIITRSRDKLQSEGCVSFAQSAAKYILSSSKAKITNNFLLSDDEIKLEAEGVIRFSKPNTHSTYDSTEFQPLPEQLARINELPDSTCYNIYRFGNTVVDGNNQLIRTATGSYILPMGVGNINDHHPKESRWCKAEAAGRVPLSNIVRNKIGGNQSKKHIETGFLLGAKKDRSTNPCTWRTENLPKLRLYKHINKITKNDIKLIFLGDLNKMQESTLKAMGYDIREIITVSDGRATIESLYIPEYPMRIRNGQFSVLDSDIRWVRDEAASGITCNNSMGNSKIYVSRETAKRRRITNEDEVSQMLRKRGFKKVEPAGLTLQEEINVFNNADVIFGLHGANMAGIVFSKSANVLELFPKGGICEHYFVIANQLGLSYDCLVCETSQEGIESRHRDIAVDTRELKKFLDYNVD